MWTLDSFIQNNEAPVDGPRYNPRGGGVFTIPDASQLQGQSWDPGLRRPYIENGQIWVDVTTGYVPRKDASGRVVYNARGEVQFQREIEPQRMVDRLRWGLPVLQVDNATVLRKDQWITLDNVVQQAVRQRLRFWALLRSRVTFGGFDGMATTILEHELMTDAGEASMSMEGLDEGRNFNPNFLLQGLPLPITHADFHLSERFLASSRGKGQPADLIRAEMAGRRVGELIEKVAIGIVPGNTYGVNANYLQTSKVWGAMTHPARITKVDMTTPLGTNPGAVKDDLLEARELMYANNYFGPFVWFHSTDYDRWLDDDYFSGTFAQGLTSGSRTLRQRMTDIEGITGAMRLDYLPGSTHPFTSLLVDVSESNVRAVNGMEINTVQWESKGGMQKNFKVMCIQVPWFRSAIKSGTSTEVLGVAHLTTS